jgi:hypothetical protein
MESAQFIADNPEDGDHNQYWYSKFTIDKIIEDQVLQHAVGGSPNGGLTIAFLSTPSLYYSLPEELRRNSYLFDFDTGPKEKTWSTDRGYVFYDFHNPTEIPSHLLGQVDMVVIDPPFIVADVWMKYIETSKLLLKVGNDANGSPLGKVVMTTVAENSALLLEHLGGVSAVFQPSIPNLVYQYNLFTNYPSTVYSELNPEIPI